LGDGDGERNKPDSVSVPGVYVHHLRVQSFTEFTPDRPEFDECRPTSDVIDEAHFVAVQILDFHQFGPLAQSDPNFAALLRDRGRRRERTEKEGGHERSVGAQKQSGCAHEVPATLRAARATDSVVGFHHTIPT
jgi:hypothetical protein